MRPGASCLHEHPVALGVLHHSVDDFWGYGFCRGVVLSARHAEVGEESLEALGSSAGDPHHVLVGVVDEGRSHADAGALPRAGPFDGHDLVAVQQDLLQSNFNGEG